MTNPAPQCGAGGAIGGPVAPDSAERRRGAIADRRDASPFSLFPLIDRNGGDIDAARQRLRLRDRWRSASTSSSALPACSTSDTPPSSPSAPIPTAPCPPGRCSRSGSSFWEPFAVARPGRTASTRRRARRRALHRLVLADACRSAALVAAFFGVLFGAPDAAAARRLSRDRDARLRRDRADRRAQLRRT